MAKEVKINVGGDTSKYERNMRNVKRINKKVTQEIRTSWVQLAAAIYGTAKAYEFLKLGTRARQEAEAFRNMAASYGASSDHIIQKLKEASGGAVDTMTLINKAGTAMMMGIAPEKISKLMEIARATSKMTGQSVTKSFEDISLAVGRQSKMILDNLGIIVQAGKANEDYARELGKLAKDLSEAEKKQAFLNATVLAGEDLVRRLGKQTKTTSEMFQSFEAMISNVKVGLSKGLLVAIKWIVMAFAQAGKVINQTLGQITGGWGMIFGLVGNLPGGEMLGFKALSANLKAISENFNLAAEKANKFTLELLEVQQSSGAASTMGGPTGVPGLPSSPEKVKEKISELQRITEKYWQDEAIRAAEAMDAASAYMGEHNQHLIDLRYELMGKRMELNQWEHDAAIQLMQMQAQEELRIEEQTQKMRMQGQRTLIDNVIKTGKLIMDISGKQNKALFRAVQVVSAGKAAIYAYQSAAKAMSEVPWPLNVAVAASNLAFGMAQVAAIMAQSPGGGAAAAGVPAVSTSTAPVYAPYPGGAMAGTEGRPTTNIYIQGDFIGEETWIDYLIEKLNQAGEARDVYIYASHARTAEELGY
ncbi:MAG: hypothetical protein JRJ86_15750 [Deltaproteobacteria bacterium]|nr:hypothetical protein [Deltaproteobacteria bacterium]